MNDFDDTELAEIVEKLPKTFYLIINENGNLVKTEFWDETDDEDENDDFVYWKNRYPSSVHTKYMPEGYVKWIITKLKGFVNVFFIFLLDKLLKMAYKIR